MSSNTEVKKWKKKTYISADILMEDVFYAKTPNLNLNFPPSNKAIFTVLEKRETRSTLEEIDETDEKITKEDPTVDQSKPTEV